MAMEEKSKLRLGDDGMLYVVDDSDGKSKTGSRLRRVKESKTKHVIIALSVILLTAAGAVGYLFLSTQEEKSVLGTSVDNLSFDVFTPQPAPNGYTQTEVKLDSTNSMASYSLNGEKQVFVNIQPIPDGFDPKTRFQKNPVPSTVSPIGTIYNLSEPNQKRFMVVTGKSLVFVSGSPFVEDRLILDIIDRMKSV